MNAGNSSSPYFTLTLPNEFVTYNVSTAVNTQGLGSGQSINISVCLGKNREEGVCLQYLLYAGRNAYFKLAVATWLFKYRMDILNYIIIQSIHIVLHNWQVLTLLQLSQWKLIDVDTVSWNRTQSMMCGDTIVG